jgi:hypothetical protein
LFINGLKADVRVETVLNKVKYKIYLQNKEKQKQTETQHSTADHDRMGISASRTAAKSCESTTGAPSNKIPPTNNNGKKSLSKEGTQ